MTRMLAAIVVALPILAPAPTAASPVAADTAMTPNGVSLITGETVTYHKRAEAEPVVTVTKPRESVRYTIQTTGDDTFVIPSDVHDDVDSGRVDRELFNIPGLIRQNLDDTVAPLIVGYDADLSTRTTAERAERLPGAEVTRTLPVIDAVAIDVDPHRRAAFFAAAADDRTIDRIGLDRRLTVALDKSVPRIGAPALWQRGHDGKGVTIAVLDTGIDSTHPDVSDRITATRNFTEEPDTADGHGHGTHVASIAAGTGSASDGDYRGVAPGAALVIGKVCDSDGLCPESAILAGMEWAARSGATVVNLSLGTGGGSDGRDPLSTAVNRLTLSTGTLFVVAAGNSGCAPCVGAPGAATNALTVGAADASDAPATFSSRGPRLHDAAIKPEITAPGTDIVAARASGTAMGSPVDDDHTSASGTSMATPHVVGSAALLAQAHPDWTWIDLKKALTSTAKDTDAAAFAEGAGRVDVDRADTADLTGPTPIHFGRQAGVGTKMFSYTNTTDAPVTVKLKLDLRTYTGKPAADGVATIKDTTLTVPANGSAQAQITVHPFRATPGVYAGTVTATAGDATVRTPFSFYKPTPTVPVTIKVTGFDGKPLPGDKTFQLARGNSLPDDPMAPATIIGVPVRDGVGTAKVPVGTYTAFGLAHETGADKAAWLAETNVTVTKATDITLDARETVPAAVDTNETVDTRNHQLVLAYNSTAGSWGSAIASTTKKLYATPVAEVDGPDRLTIQALWTLTGTDKPTVYNLNFSHKDGIPDSLTFDATPGNLKTIKTRYLAGRSGLTLHHAWFALRGDSAATILLPRFETAAPVAYTEYVTPDAALRWNRWVELRDQAGNNYTLHEFSSGPDGAEDWYSGPITPAAPGFYRLRANDHDLIYPTGFISDGDLDHVLDVNTKNYPIKWKLFQGDKQIPGAPTPGSSVPTFPIHDDQPLDYRLESTLTLPATSKTGPSLATHRTSVTVDTQWTFRSGKATGTDCSAATGAKVCDRLPAIQLGYDLGLDPHHQAPAGRDHTVSITPRHPNAADIAGLKLSFSTDEGDSWKDATTTADGDTFTATIPNPTDPDAYVWLRVEAWDDNDNRVVQTVHRAYALTASA
ncbi:S8 family peptidase [Stackebrandtia nassauensis]|nr:S8 family peptidase [Stackebrandtia nassauensis]